jgi:hypothetical protein
LSTDGEPAFYFAVQRGHVFVHAHDYRMLSDAWRAADDAARIFGRPVRFTNLIIPIRPKRQIELFEL